jgi:hypothetical protein
MKKVKTSLAIIFIIALSVGVGLALPATSTHPQPASAATSDKYDGDCTGSETAGRCADKCPADTAEGAYFVRGNDKDTGAVVCGFSYYHACPYSEAVSADNPLCYKGQPATATTPAATTPVTTTNNQCGGK